jgi:cold shock CspA family protein
MKGPWALGAALLLATGFAGAEPTTAKSHARTLTGTIATVESAGKGLTVRDDHGKDTRLEVTSATRITGGTLQPGQKVTVRWMLRDKKNIATAVRVHAPEAERTASATASSPLSPTPKSR